MPWHRLAAGRLTLLLLGSGLWASLGTGETDVKHALGAGAKDMTYEEWCAAKNADAGPAVSAFLTERGTWRADPQPTLSADRVPGITDEVPASVVHDVLSADECRGLIAGWPSEGSAGSMSGDRVAALYKDRQVKSRTLSFDEPLAEALFQRLSGHLPAELDGGRLYRVNPNFRFVHYDTGGHHFTHIDGREPGSPAYDEVAGGWIQSRLTIQVYLNSHGHDFEGGEFEFVDAAGNSSEESVKYRFLQTAGDAVVFYQERLSPASRFPPYELQHRGADVTKGEKFCARTMVDYVFPDPNRALLANIKDDVMIRRGEHVVKGACVNERANVLAIGNTIIDNIYNTPEIPVDDKVIVDSKTIYVGGQGSNAALTMALLGLNVSWMSRIGDDAGGEIAKDRYNQLHMDLSHTMVVPGAATSSSAIIVTNNGHRSILIHDDKAMYIPGGHIIEAVIKRLDAGDFKAVYTDGWQIDLALPVVRAAAARGIPIVADCEVLNEKTRELAEHATALIAPLSIIQALSGVEDVEAALLALLKSKRQGDVVIASDSARGSWGARHGDSQVLHVPAIPIGVKDTTGAGDSFHAGYLTAMVRGLDLFDALNFATHVAAAKCETPGPVVTPEALRAFGVLSSLCS